jgi:hypothetical protein
MAGDCRPCAESWRPRWADGSRIGHGYGSEWHLLRWLGYHRADLSRRVAEVLGARDVHWLDVEGTSRPSGPFDRDLEWVNFDFLPAVHPARVAWRSAWPRAWGRIGPHWDAVGVASIDGTDEWILVEAKANVAEVRLRLGSRVAGASRARITGALTDSAPAFGATVNDAWLDRGYQIANRLCALKTLVENGAQAHLLFLYFCGDDASCYRRGAAAESTVCCPRDEAEWRGLVLDELHARMGWHPGCGELGDRVHEMFLSVDAIG